MTTAERIIKARSAAKLSQRDLARISGCSQQTICDIEHGARSKYLPEIARALGVSVEWLCLGERKNERGRRLRC